MPALRRSARIALRRRPDAARIVVKLGSLPNIVKISDEAAAAEKSARLAQALRKTVLRNIELLHSIIELGV